MRGRLLLWARLISKPSRSELESSSPLALEPDDLGVDAALLAAESNLLIVTLDKLLNEPMMMMSFFVLAGTKIGAELHKYGARTI